MGIMKINNKKKKKKAERRIPQISHISNREKYELRVYNNFNTSNPKGNNNLICS